MSALAVQEFISCFAGRHFSCRMCGAHCTNEPLLTPCGHLGCRPCFVKRIVEDQITHCVECSNHVDVDSLMPPPSCMSLAMNELLNALPQPCVRQSTADPSRSPKSGRGSKKRSPAKGVPIEPDHKSAPDGFQFNPPSFSQNTSTATLEEQTSKLDISGVKSASNTPDRSVDGEAEVLVENMRGIDLQNMSAASAPSSTDGTRCGDKNARTGNKSLNISASSLQSDGRRTLKVKRPSAATPQQLNPNTNPPSAQFRDHQSAATLLAQEDASRNRLQMDENLCWLEVEKRRAVKLKAIRASRKGSSKQLKMQADECYERGDYRAALEFYTRAIDEDDGTTRSLMIYGNRSAAFFMLHRYEECKSDCKAVLKEEPKNVKMHQRVAKACANMAMFSEAIESLVLALESAKHNRDLRHVSVIEEEKRRCDRGAAVYASVTGITDPKEKEEVLTSLAKDFPDTMRFKFDLADLMLATGRFEKVVEDMRREPLRTPKVCFYMAKAYYYTGFEAFHKAIQTLQDTEDSECKALLALITRVDHFKHIGNHRFQERKWNEASEAYTEALNLDGTNQKAMKILYCNRAAAYKELGRYREGIEDCTNAIKADPTMAKPYARRARCLQELGDHENAVKDFKMAVQYEPGDTTLAQELRMAETKLRREGDREKDHYYVLGVERTASSTDVKKKYRELSLKWHPDKCVNFSEDEKATALKRFKLISEAYSVLSDAVKKREYDLKLDRERLQQRGRYYDVYNDQYNGFAYQPHNPAAGKGTFSTRSGSFGNFQRYPRTNSDQF